MCCCQAILFTVYLLFLRYFWCPVLLVITLSLWCCELDLIHLWFIWLVRFGGTLGHITWGTLIGGCSVGTIGFSAWLKIVSNWFIYSNSAVPMSVKGMWCNFLKLLYVPVMLQLPCLMKIETEWVLCFGRRGFNVVIYLLRSCFLGIDLPTPAMFLHWS